MRSRPRRNRVSETVRKLVCETHLSVEQLILPAFVCEGKKIKSPIKSLPGQCRYSIDLLLEMISKAQDLGVNSIALFPKIEEGLKDSVGSESKNPQGLYLRALRAIKKEYPQIHLISDVALDPYSSDGHDGIVKNGRILNDESLVVLSQMAVAQAEAGADWVAPSDMMDGRVGAIRAALDQKNLTEVGILSYTAKYASALYGPFRDALDSAPKSGDKKTYQMDPANRREALRELKLDIQEGADVVMVKPAGFYLDVIRDLRCKTTLPIAAYQVSGEYAMIKAAQQNRWLDGDAVLLESLLAIRRAGADMILTYGALEVAELLSRP